MDIIYYSHGFSIIFISLFFIMLFNGIWFWWTWVFLLLPPFFYTPVLYRRPTTATDESLALVEQRNVESFYNNVIKF